VRREIKTSLAIGVVTTILVVVVILALAASTTWLDSPLGIGTHQAPGSDLVQISVDGTHRSQLTHDPAMMHWGPAWSRNGHHLVYSYGVPSQHADQLVMTGPDGSSSHALTHNGRENYLAVWSPDGRRLAYISQDGTNTATAELFLIGADGRGEKRLTRDNAWEYGASWSPDGKQIAYGSKQGGVWHVWIVNADGRNAHILAGTAQGNAPDWSPDGRTIAFKANRTGNDNIYLVSASGGTARRVTQGPCHSGNARWSPDGQRLAYAVFCDHGWNDIYVMNADGSQPRDLTNTSSVEEEVPSWLPDGHHIGFTAFQIERDSLWPEPVLKGLGLGLLLGLMVASVMYARGRVAGAPGSRV